MSSTREKLERAMAEQRLVRIDRRPQFADRCDGFVVAIGAKWLLVQVEVDGGHVDGYRAARLRDVKRVSRIRSFSTRVARTLPSWPPVAPPGVVLDSTRELLASAGAGRLLIGIEREALLSNAMWIGQFVTVEGKKLWMKEITTRARWRKKQAGYKLKQITTVTFDNRYLATLELAAGPPRVAEPV